MHTVFSACSTSLTGALMLFLSTNTVNIRLLASVQKANPGVWCEPVYP